MYHLLFKANIPLVSNENINNVLIFVPLKIITDEMHKCFEYMYELHTCGCGLAAS